MTVAEHKKKVQELRNEVSTLRFIGSQMSNCLFNASQWGEKRINPVDAKVFGELVRKWDRITRTL